MSGPTSSPAELDYLAAGERLRELLLPLKAQGLKEVFVATDMAAAANLAQVHPAIHILYQGERPLEGKTAAPAAAAGETAGNPAVAQTQPTVDPVQAGYDQALGLLRQRDFKKAIPALKSFIDANPQAPDARYWLGVAYNAERQFQPAIDTYQRFIELSPNHPRVPDAMRNLGGCQRDLGDTARAKSTWQALIKKFPKSEAAQKAKQQLASLK